MVKWLDQFTINLVKQASYRFPQMAIIADSSFPQYILQIFEKIIERYK